MREQGGELPNPPPGGNGTGRPPPPGFGQPAAASQPPSDRPQAPPQPAPAATRSRAAVASRIPRAIRRRCAAAASRARQPRLSRQRRRRSRVRADRAAAAACHRRRSVRQLARRRSRTATARAVHRLRRRAGAAADTGRAVPAPAIPIRRCRPRSLDAPRITPRSPRAALEPEHVPMPTRRSKRARNPLVIVGNAIFTLADPARDRRRRRVLVGKQRFEAPGPLAADKIVNIPRGSACATSPTCCEREGVIDQPWVFIGGALVLQGARRAQVRRISVPQARQPARRRRDHHRRQGGAAPLHDRRRA